MWRILPSVTNHQFRAVVENELAARRVSPVRAARRAGLNRDALRSVLRGRAPSIERAADVCRALGWALRIEARRDQQHDGAHNPDYARAYICPPTDFTEDRKLSVRESTPAPRERFWSTETEAESATAPAPVGLSDPAAFYAGIRSDTLTPLNIWRTDVCLVSPSAPIEAPQRVWLQDDQGRQTILCLIRMTDETYQLVGWGPPKPKPSSVQEMFAVHLKRNEIVDRGAVVAVYRTTPSLSTNTHRAPYWPPPTGDLLP